MSAIMLVEPHPLLRLGILQLLSSGLSGSTAKGVDYTALSETCAEKGCELLILSIPSFERFHQLISAASHAYEPKAILLLSESSGIPDWIQECPPIVLGYVPKSATPELLLAAVKLVLAGGTCFPLQNPAAAERPANANGMAPIPHAEPARWNARTSASGSERECEKLGLTPRQYEVLVLLARGYPMKTIGSMLNISVATAKAHTEMLYQRLDVHSRNAAVYTAISRGATLGWPSIQAAQQQYGASRDHDGAEGFLPQGQASGEGLSITARK
ncbi:response regulator transcription factor [Paracandidimonas soli]|uniref:response regulator transcription factor n=1 Tax=Paracandidimonas soli TaxID=1917182 RepID=UPI00333E5C81